MNAIEALAHGALWVLQAAGWTIYKLGQLSIYCYKALVSGPKADQKAPPSVKAVPPPLPVPQSADQPVLAQHESKDKPTPQVTLASGVTPKPITDGATRVDKAELRGPGQILLGYMWVYLYDSARVARRVFKVADRDLITILRRDRFFFPDVPFEPAMGSKPIMDGLHKECQRLVDPHKKRLADQRERKKVEVAPVKAAPKPAPVVVQATIATQPQEAAVAAPRSEPSAVVPASARVVKGQVYAGVVTLAGMTKKVGRDGTPYETFCLTIHDGSKEVPLFGNELQRQSTDSRIRPGDRVSVVCMGEEPFLGRGGVLMHKNLYQLTRLGAT